MIDASLFPALLSLLTVARSGSVGAAARLHHRTSSAISQQIRKLGRHLGVPLLERAGAASATAAGERAARHLSSAPRRRRSSPTWPSCRAARPRPCASRSATTSARPCWCRCCGSCWRSGCRCASRSPPPTHARASAWWGSARWTARWSVGRRSRAGSKPSGSSTSPSSGSGPRGPGKRLPLPDRLAHEPLLRLGAGSQGRRLLEDYLTRERIQPASTIDVPSVSLLLAYVSGGLGVGLAPALAVAELDRARARWERAAVPSLPVTLVHRPGFRRGAAAAARGG
jgi:hypothetical protein